MNATMVDMSSAIVGGPAAVTEPRPLLGITQTRQALGDDSAPNQQQTEQIVGKMQEQLESMNVSLEYSNYGDRGEKIAVAVVNKETGELIREIPPKELRNLYAKMSELTGMIFNREI